MKPEGWRRETRCYRSGFLARKDSSETAPLKRALEGSAEGLADAQGQGEVEVGGGQEGMGDQKVKEKAEGGAETAWACARLPPGGPGSGHASDRRGISGGRHRGRRVFRGLSGR